MHQLRPDSYTEDAEGNIKLKSALQYQKEQMEKDPDFDQVKPMPHPKPG